MGEFGFVLGSALVTAGAIPGSDYVALLAAVGVSIAASAILVRAAIPGGRRKGRAGRRRVDWTGPTAGARCGDRASEEVLDDPGTSLRRAAA